MDFPNRLKELRLEKKLTQEELGKKVNVTKVSISGYESGNRKPDIDTLEKLADFFGVIVDYLLGKTDYKTTKEIAAKWNEIADEAKGMPAVKEHVASEEDPQVSRFFKDFQNSPKKSQEETIRFHEFLKQQEKDRKLGNEQGS